jgi:hypothetical protein
MKLKGIWLDVLLYWVLITSALYFNYLDTAPSRDTKFIYQEF